MNKLSSNKNIKQTIVTLLTNLGTESEVRKYLNRFSDSKKPSFAIIKIGGSIIQNDLEKVASSISFIQEVGLTPIIVHGAGPQLNSELEKHAISTQFIDGKRVTTTDVLHIARKVFIQENQKFIAALEHLGVNATPITNGLFNCKLSSGKLGLVGDIQSIANELIETILKRGSIPVIAPLGETASGQIVNINADSVTFALAKNLQPYKIIFLTETGGVLDNEGKIIPVINLKNDFNDLINQKWLHSGMLFKLTQIKQILDTLPKSTSVSITKPDQLAKELFTHRGSGTLINSGENITEYSNWQDADRTNIANVIDSSFGKKLNENYFNETPLLKLYVTDNNKGLAIMTNHFSIPYLDKFCVTQSAKGEGVGSSLWKKITQNHSKLFWRARTSNPINKFYRNAADGFVKEDNWSIYWYGDFQPEEMIQCLHWAKNKPVTVGNSYE